MRKKDVLKKIGWHAVFLFALYVLQTAVFSRLLLFGASPIILPVAAAGIALFQGEGGGGVFGLAAGMLCDMAYDETGVMFTLLLTAIGLGVGFLSEKVLARGFPSYVLCALIALAVTAFFQMFSLLVFERVPAAALVTTALNQTLYSAFFILPLYFPIRRISRRIKPM